MSKDFVHIKPDKKINHRSLKNLGAGRPFRIKRSRTITSNLSIPTKINA